MTYEFTKKRIAYLANENVGNFQQMQGLASGSHAIGVGCSSTSASKVSYDHHSKKCDSVHAFSLLKVSRTEET